MNRFSTALFALLMNAASSAQTVTPAQPAAARQYFYFIPAPHSPDEWDSWRTGLRQWKESLRNYPGMDHVVSTAPAAYSCFFLMANELSLYDSDWNYTIKACLDKYERQYGGVDEVLLWSAYPQLGFDDRDQFAFYRNLPGGAKALKRLSETLHAMGKKLLIAYNPWDGVSRDSGRNDEDELIGLAKEIGADGIFLDTISGVKGFREKVQRSGYPLFFQSEISPDPAMLPEIRESWFELPVWADSMRNREYDEVPFVIRNRWIDQQHQVFHLSRWSHEQAGIFQNAFLNGAGIVLWENIFGTVNELNARDRSILASMLPIMRRYSDFFTKGQWTPLALTQLYRTYASLWEMGDRRLWTIINRQDQAVSGQLLDIIHIPGTRYFDLVAGKRAETIFRNGKAQIYAALGPLGIACILAIPSEDSALILPAAPDAAGATDASYRTPIHVLRPVPPTRPYLPSALPPGMIAIPVPGDSITMEIHFRQRECGFYPARGVTDISYTMALDRPGIAVIRTKLQPYAMDATPVTNAQFATFVSASGYHPKFADNYLKDWVNGAPSRAIGDRPVTWITLDDARAYAAWAGKRLPTEEEWQWAAQGGEGARAYPWGNQYDSSRCNHGQTGHSTEVKRFKTGRTLQGLYDMCGNVWEFTESERTDGHNRYAILRGGSWYSNPGSGWYADQGPQPTDFAAKYLFTWPGSDRCATIGFRCVVDTR